MKFATRILTPDDFGEKMSSEEWAMRNIGPIGVACEIDGILYVVEWSYNPRPGEVK